MFGNSVLSRTAKASCIVTVASVMMFLVGLTVAPEVSHTPAKPAESVSAKLAILACSISGRSTPAYHGKAYHCLGKLREHDKALSLIWSFCSNFERSLS